MNRTKVVKAIKDYRNLRSGLANSKDLSDIAFNALGEALEEIASEANTKALQAAMPAMVNPGLNGQLAKLLSALLAVQVPKEVVYAYPITMSRHFSHYRDKYFGGHVPNKDDPGIKIYDTEKDDFGCGWTKFTGPKELVEFLRENNIPIKVIE